MKKVSLQTRISEAQLQIRIANHLRLKYPRLLWTIAPAGADMSPAQRKKMKDMGYRNGTLDILVFMARHKFHGLFVEVKIPGGVVSDDQREFIRMALDNGYATAICWSYEEAIRTIEGYIGG